MRGINIYLLLMTALFTFSCSDDESSDLNNSNNVFVFDGQKYTGEYGAIMNYGDRIRMDSVTEYVFQISDAPYTKLVDESLGKLWDFGPSGKPTFEINVSLITRGNTFITGNFTTANTSNQIYRDDIDIYIDSNGDGDVFGASDFSAEIGRANDIVLSGTFPNYKLTLDVVTQGGLNLSGSFEGTFKYAEDK